MTDLFESTDALPPSLPLADEATGDPLPANSCPECAAEGKVESFSTPQALGSHRRKKHDVMGTRDAERAAKPGAPPKVNINLGQPKPNSKAGKDAARVAKTAKGATSFMNTVAAGCLFINQPEDAQIVAANAEGFGAAIGELSQYQPWLSSIFAPGGEMSGEVAAWLGLAAVSAAIVIPVGARHGWIPEKIATAFGVAVAAPDLAAANEPRAA